MHYVYFLKSQKDEKLYIGSTSNLRDRIVRHNAKQVFSTKSRVPLKLIYYEAFLSKEDAEMKEKFYKTGWGRNHIQKFLKNTINLKI